MTLEELLKAKREEILKGCAKYGAHDVRVFGPVVRAEADEASTLLNDSPLSFNKNPAYLTNGE